VKDLPDLSNPAWFLVAALVVYIIVMGRYFLISGIFYLVLYRWKKKQFTSRKISAREYNKGQFLTEIIRSNLTALLFGISGAVLALLWQKGYTKIYTDIHDHSLLWLPLSLIIALLLQETYYYWLHRWMHIPSVYRLVHKWHHDSQVASPWTAFSFHPLEGLIQAIFLPTLLLFLPMHLYVLILMLVIMSFSSVINHLDIELYPKWFNRYVFTRWLIGATHHSLHHKQYKYNYGLYFTFWDKWAGTESPHFNEVFDQKAK
jgi:lathosterol oxidase